jgi:hypothetical protein
MGLCFVGLGLRPGADGVLAITAFLVCSVLMTTSLSQQRGLTVGAKFSVAVVDSIPVHAQASGLPESSAISCASPEQYQRTSTSCLPQKASAVLPLNITTIALAVFGLVLMSVFVLLATALASAVILGTLDGAWVLQVAGLWLLILCGFVATMHRRAAARENRRGALAIYTRQRLRLLLHKGLPRL